MTLTDSDLELIDLIAWFDSQPAETRAKLVLMLETLPLGDD